MRRHEKPSTARKKIKYLTGFSLPTINKVVKEYFKYGDFIDENGPRLRKNAFEKLPVHERDLIRKIVSSINL